jgi:type III secretory pathway component EscV
MLLTFNISLSVMLLLISLACLTLQLSVFPPCC